MLHNTTLRQALNGIEFLTIQELQDLVQTWPSKYGSLRLGYWQRADNPDGPLVYGIHFLPLATSGSAGEEKDGESRFVSG